MSNRGCPWFLVLVLAVGCILLGAFFGSMGRANWFAWFQIILLVGGCSLTGWFVGRAHKWYVDPPVRKRKRKRWSPPDEGISTDLAYPRRN